MLRPRKENICGEVPGYLECPLCLFIVQDPVQLLSPLCECNVVWCRFCLEKSLRRSAEKRCPVCNKLATVIVAPEGAATRTAEVIRRSLPAKEALEKLEAKCPNRRCEWTGPIHGWAHHLENCGAERRDRLSEDKRRLNLDAKALGDELREIKRRRMKVEEEAYVLGFSLQRTKEDVRWAVDGDEANEAGWEPLHKAVMANDLKTVKKLVWDSSDLNRYDYCERSPLYLAAQEGNQEMVEYLVDKGPSKINIANDKMWTPLHIAVRNGFGNVVKLLLAKKATLHVKTDTGENPLHIAAAIGNETIVALLIEAGAKTDVQDKNKNTPAHIAAEFGHVEVMKRLIEAKAKVDSRNGEGESSLHVAATHGHEEVVGVLIPKAKLDSQAKDKSTPLHAAAGKGHFLVVEALLEGGASIDLKDELGEVPLHKAARSGNMKVVTHVAEKDTRAVNYTSHDGGLPLHLAARNCHAQVVEFLVKKDPSTVDAQRNDGSTPLHLVFRKADAFALAREFIVRYLVEAKAKIDVKKKNGATPVYLACENGALEDVKLLLGKGRAKLVPANGDDTPLHAAAGGGHSDVVQLLLNKEKETVDSKNKKGDTPLHWASDHGEQEAVEALVKGGADVNIPNCEKKTPLHSAVIQGHQKVVEFLVNEAKAKTDLKDNDSMTPLHEAVERGRQQLVEILVKGKAKLNLKNKQQRTALGIANKSGKTEIAQYLKSWGARS